MLLDSRVALPPGGSELYLWLLSWAGSSDPREGAVGLGRGCPEGQAVCGEKEWEIPVRE